MRCCDKDIEVKSSDYFRLLLEQAHTPADLRAESEAEQGQGGAICQAEVVAASSFFPTNSEPSVRSLTRHLASLMSIDCLRRPLSIAVAPTPDGAAEPPDL